MNPSFPDFPDTLKLNQLAPLVRGSPLYAQSYLGALSVGYLMKIQKNTQLPLYEIMNYAFWPNTYFYYFKFLPGKCHSQYICSYENIFHFTSTGDQGRSWMFSGNPCSCTKAHSSLSSIEFWPLFILFFPGENLSLISQFMFCGPHRAHLFCVAL